MDTLLILTILILVILVISLIILLIKSKTRQSQQDTQSIIMLQNQLGQITEQLNQRLAQMTEHMSGQLNNMTSQMNTRLSENINIVGAVQKTLGQLDESNKRIFEVGKDISSLQELLSTPSFRGEIGEFFLDNLLSQIFPPQYFTLKYEFKNGEIVDAVIKISDKLVPVDSKFPLENFKKMVNMDSEEETRKSRKDFIRDVKKHIDAISKKYILPDEGTFEFALMYIPAENVYYETIIKDGAIEEEKGLCSYALSKKVIPVSPNSFYAYLQVILLGLKGMSIEKTAREIVANLGRLQVDLTKFKEDFDIIGKHISNTRTKYEEAERKLNRFTDKLTASSELKVSESSEDNTKRDKDLLP